MSDGRRSSDPMMYRPLRRPDAAQYQRRSFVSGRSSQPQLISDFAVPTPQQQSRVTIDTIIHSPERTSSQQPQPIKVIPPRPMPPVALPMSEWPAVIRSAPNVADSKDANIPLAVRLRQYIIRRPGSLRSVGLTVAAVLLLGSGLAIGMQGLRTNHQAKVQADSLAHQSAAATQSGTTTDDAVPTETKPSGVATYRVAANLPRVIRIVKLGVEARVLRLGVTTSNALGTPGNIFDTGWYDGSATPGSAGAVLIDGHVSGPTQQGVFYNLKKLVAGDKIQIERGDGTILNYQVVTTKTYPADKVDMAAALTPVTASKPGLNLITCTGQLDSSKTHFQDRLVVFASQI